MQWRAPVRRIDRQPPLACLEVERPTRGDEQWQVGDRIPDSESVAVLLDVQRLVQIHRPGRIDRDEGSRGLVPLRQLEAAAATHRGHLVEHLRRELGGHVELGTDRLEPAEQHIGDVEGVVIVRPQGDVSLRHDQNLSVAGGLSPLQSEHGQGRPEIVCGAHLLLTDGTEDGQHLSRLPPAQGRDDGLDRPDRSRGVVAPVHDQSIGNTPGAAGLSGAPVIPQRAADRQEDSVEIVLERTAHVSEVRRGDEDDRVGPAQLLDVRLERRPDDHVDTLDRIVPSPCHDCLDQAPEGVGGAVVHDEQGRHLTETSPAYC